MSGEKPEDGVQSEEFASNLAVSFEGCVARFQRDLDDTPHLWLSLALIYSYLVLFAVAAVPAVTRP